MFAAVLTIFILVIPSPLKLVVRSGIASTLNSDGKTKHRTGSNGRNLDCGQRAVKPQLIKNCTWPNSSFDLVSAFPHIERSECVTLTKVARWCGMYKS